MDLGVVQRYCPSLHAPDNGTIEESIRNSVSHPVILWPCIIIRPKEVVFAISEENFHHFSKSLVRGHDF